MVIISDDSSASVMTVSVVALMTDTSVIMTYVGYAHDKPYQTQALPAMIHGDTHQRSGRQKPVGTEKFRQDT
jgi:hypothetical protein